MYFPTYEMHHQPYVNYPNNTMHADKLYRPHVCVLCFIKCINLSLAEHNLIAQIRIWQNQHIYKHTRTELCVPTHKVRDDEEYTQYIVTTTA